MTETAMVLLMALLVIVFISQVCLMIYTYGVYAEAVRAGVRYAQQHGSDSTACSGPTTGCTDTTGANVTSTVKSYVSQFTTFIAGSTVSVSYPDNSCAPNSRVIVSVTYTYIPFTNMTEFRASHKIVAQGRILY